ncbi:MAG TPA: NAD(+) diphosphatase [Rhizomicrobium sp.]|jgi:NAD+ diphosphatase
MIPFTGNRLDRASDRRTDAAWVAAQRTRADSRIFPFRNLQPFVRENTHAGFFAPGPWERLAGPDAVCVFLGLGDGRAVFALDVSAAPEDLEQDTLFGSGQFVDMRSAAALLPSDEVAILGQAKALIDWHARHGFCPRCGAPTTLVDAGYRRHCDACGAEHFPRTDPVVIMLAIHGEDCLVGRGRHFAPGMFSALAGFIEPGETIEEAVRREIFEEAGIRIGRVTYHATQPWPFPSSLMIGCFAEALSREIRIDDNELAEARWLGRAEARALLRGESHAEMRVPNPIAIAHHLLNTWAGED